MQGMKQKITQRGAQGALTLPLSITFDRGRRGRCGATMLLSRNSVLSPHDVASAHRGRGGFFQAWSLRFRSRRFHLENAQRSSNICARGSTASPVEIRSNPNGRHYWCQGGAGIRSERGRENGEMSAPVPLALAPPSYSAGSRTSCSCRVLRRQWPRTRKPAPPAVNRSRHPRIGDAVKRPSAGLAWQQGRGPSSHTDPGAGNSCCTNRERTPGMSLRSRGGPRCSNTRQHASPHELGRPLSRRVRA